MSTAILLYQCHWRESNWAAQHHCRPLVSYLLLSSKSLLCRQWLFLHQRLPLSRPRCSSNLTEDREGKRGELPCRPPSLRSFVNAVLSLLPFVSGQLSPLPILFPFLYFQYFLICFSLRCSPHNFSLTLKKPLLCRIYKFTFWLLPSSSFLQIYVFCCISE